MDGCTRQNPAYRPAKEKPRSGGAFLLARERLRWCNKIGGGRFLVVGELVIRPATRIAALAAALTLYVPAVAHAVPGDLDPSFSKDGLAIAEFTSKRTPKFRTSGGGAAAVAVQPDGRLVALGSSAYSSSIGCNRLTGCPSRSYMAMARFTSDGALDPSFGALGRIEFDQEGLRGSDLAIQNDGRILVAGPTRVPGEGQSKPAAFVVRVNGDGSVDQSYGQQGVAVVTLEKGFDLASMTLDREDRVVLLGTTVEASPPDDDLALARLSVDGALDESFATDGVTVTPDPGDQTASALAPGPGGRITVAGTTFIDEPRNFEVLAARYTSDGDLDPTFDGDGKATSDRPDADGFMYDVDDMILDSEGRVLVTGMSYLRTVAGSGAFLLRLTHEGQLDPALGGDGWEIVRPTPPDQAIPTSERFSLAEQADGRIILAGRNSQLGRLNSDGSIDRSFSRDGWTQAGAEGYPPYADVLVLPDGRVLTAGIGTDSFGRSGMLLARFLVSDGPPDADADGVLDSNDRCPDRYGGRGGCPVHARTAKLRRREKWLVLRIDSESPGCIRGDSVLLRKRRGKDDRIAKDDDYRYWRPGLDPGRYYVRVRKDFDPGHGYCKRAVSKAVRVGPAP
jgi:uncharacterized delta-60 repeat protein